MEGWLTSADGKRLYWQGWEAPSPRATVVLVHGLAEHGGRYAHVGERLARAGYSSVVLDHRGHGRSDGARANITRMDALVDDVHRLKLQAGADYMIGHSMGGAVALRYAIRHPDALKALVVSGPAVAVDPEPPAVQKAALGALSRLTPNLRVLGLDANHVSRDPAVVRAYREDALNHTGKIPARTLHEIVSGADTIPRDAARITIPLLLVQGSEDKLAPPRGSQAVHAAVEGSELTIYDGLFHEVFNEPERDRVLDDVVAFLERH
jgi:acylglycerol lipase